MGGWIEIFVYGTEVGGGGSGGGCLGAVEGLDFHTLVLLS